ncbi:MAG TPA: helical backbone metal receptor, partial [Ferruginibacter sp.]|nr:helical backbone metal receptor [Ferruginibacter sp.]
MILTSPSLPYTPRRIISLVPSQTELLYRLGLETETVGITKFCIHPDTWYRQKTRVGGTKSLKPEIIRQLNPDLIIANKEENVQEQVETLARDYPVWVTDVNNLEDALQMIH